LLCGKDGVHGGNLIVTIVTAVSRPACIDSIIKSFCAQTYQNKSLLIVLNGAAEHSYIQSNLENLNVIRCLGGTPAIVRNAGLTHLRGSVGYICFWDDDDYYGPGYIEEVAQALKNNQNRVVGKYARYVQYDDEIQYLLGRQDTFLGGTISGWINTLPPIPDLPRDEDRVWCKNMQEAGIELFNLGPRYYLYNRRTGQHAWSSSKLQMLYSYGPSINLGYQVKEVVNSAKVPSGFFTPRPSLSDIESELLARLMSKPTEEGYFECPQKSL
jgi:glycosyltransferase involved in cell wall biosynthesis